MDRCGSKWMNLIGWRMNGWRDEWTHTEERTD